MPVKEVAGILNISVGTVKSFLFRAIKKLQKELDFYMPGSAQKGGGKVKAGESGKGLPGIDTSSGLTSIYQYPALYKKLLYRFCENQQNFYEQLTITLQKNDMENAMLLVHNLKGLAGQIGAIDLMHSAGLMEQAIKEQDNAYINELLPLINKHLKIVLDGLQQFAR